MRRGLVRRDLVATDGDGTMLQTKLLCLDDPVPQVIKGIRVRHIKDQHSPLLAHPSVRGSVRGERAPLGALLTREARTCVSL